MTDPALPRHIAIIMDGNGRWAKLRRAPRTDGHRAGARATRTIIEASVERGIEALTLFAFSSENWRRPRAEVSTLLELFRHTLKSEARRLADNDIRLRFIGDRERFPADLRHEMDRAEERTAGAHGLDVSVAVNYGGRWDITQAARALADEVRAGRMRPEDIDEEAMAERMALSHLPEPDLFIRTGGERRISNYLLWQLAYTELWFSDLLWPDFDAAALDQAIAFYQGRQRRFGRTAEQMKAVQHA